MIDEKKLMEAFEELFKPQFNAYGDFGKYSKLNLIGILKIIEEQPKIGEWIPVDEALPKEPYGDDLYDMNLVTLDDGEVCLGVYRNAEERWMTRKNEGEQWYTDKHVVIAWMPLPKAYEVQDE